MANIYLKNIGGDYSPTDSSGSGNSNLIPKVVRTLSDTLQAEFFNEDGTDMTLPTCSSFVFAADVDYLTNTAPITYTTVYVFTFAFGTTLPASANGSIVRKIADITFADGKITTITQTQQGTLITAGVL